ncbi:probable cytochrome P450 6a13 [Fopius arisanus]|uniref:Cyp6a14_0 protein n=1 Tax=Fopius arisanus TaxID=64838 RepID=A0A0C9R7N3_9HYME|nr:PREDICTED: probable cytochrome P450 6a13 [Fopius arisanus]
MLLGVVEALGALVLLFVVILYWTTAKLRYWKNRGVPGPTPVPLIGNFGGVLFRRASIADAMMELYKNWKGPFFGVYNGHSPALVIKDLDLVKNVLIKDFNVFSGRGVKINEEIDPLAGHLFNLDGPRWRSLRTKLTPVFTSGKLKHMFNLMLECADHYEKYLLQEGSKGNVVEFREVAAKFTTDVIGSCAFGISMNALSREDSAFRDAGRRLFKSSYWTILKRMLREAAPKVFETLKVKVIPTDITEFFISSVKEAMEFRKRENVIRHDLVDTLMEIEKTHDNKEFEFTESLMSAQAFVFFVAGFETSSTAISFALQELAHNPEVQDKLIEEILDTVKKCRGELSYEVVNQMKYLDMVIQESLRKDPPGITLTRSVFERYTLPGTSITLEPRTKVTIPVHAIHHDEEYYPNPEVFDPERFSEENKRMRHPMAYLPFGDGPKNCIGARFASYQVKLGLIKALKNFRVRPTSLSPFPYEIDKGSFILAPAGGIHLRLEPIEEK